MTAWIGRLFRALIGDEPDPKLIIKPPRSIYTGYDRLKQEAAITAAHVRHQQQFAEFSYRPKLRDETELPDKGTSTFSGVVAFRKDKQA